MEILPNEKCMHQPKNSDCGLIEGEFVNTKVLLGLFMQLCKFTP